MPMSAAAYGVFCCAGIQRVTQAQEEAEQDDSNGLWNGQPFRPLPAITLPDLPAGCARATFLQASNPICLLVS